MSIPRIRPQAKKRFPARGAFFALFLFTAGIFSLTLLGTGPRAALASVSVESDPDSRWTPLAFTAREGRVWLVCGGEGGLLLRLNAAGQVEARLERTDPLGWAAFRGERLFLREDREDGADLVALDPETFRETGRWALGLPPQKLALLDCGGTGAAAFVRGDDRTRLRLRAPDGTERVREFPEAISFLAADGDRWLIGTGETLTVLGPEETWELPCLAAVVGSLGNGLVLDGGGVVSRVEESGLTPLLRHSPVLPGALSFCLGRENCLILSSPGGAVTRYAPDGGLLATTALESDALAVCGAGALIRRDGDLRYAAFDFDSEESASPTASPAPTPGEEGEASVRAEGNYILVPAGTTAAQLRELFRPETADLRDLLGSPMIQGRLATGMTVNGRTVVVRGDCDGSGTVNRGDLRAAMLLILTGETQEGPAFRAADLNDDGVLDGADLLLLTRMTA